jgi:D-alanyl-D-alanine carboxypeptidase
MTIGTLTASPRRYDLRRMPAVRRERQARAARSDRRAGRLRFAPPVAALLFALAALFGPGVSPTGEPPAPAVASEPDASPLADAPRRLPGPRPIDWLDRFTRVAAAGGDRTERAATASHAEGGGGAASASATDASGTTANASADATSAALAPRFQAALDNARATSQAYGICFAAVRDGQVLWAGASGTAPDGHTPLTGDSPLVIGSLTKTFVAATVLQLVEEGRIALDDPAAEHLPDLRLPAKITIRQLLNHTSGLADLFNPTTIEALEKAPGKAWTAKQVLDALHEPWFAPGADWAYANTNYLLLSLLVERMNAATLGVELERRFLMPLDLTNTRVLDPGADAGPLLPAWASIFYGSGAMVGSARDMARWGDALYGSDGILEADTLGEMLRVNEDDYGLGTQRIELGKRVGYGHSGLLSHYTALLVHLPKENVTLALLVNRSHADAAGLLALRPGKGQSLLEVAISPP